MGREGKMGTGLRTRLVAGLVVVVFMVMMAVAAEEETGLETPKESKGKRHAYVAMMYMGTPRDYEFYVALRVMMRSLKKLKVDADLVVIASVDVPIKWQKAMKEEDGLKVVIVQNLKNPYEYQDNFNTRFKLTMNKLYAWSLEEYDRVIMIDSDNIFLQKTDELFQCGSFCAVFINPCIFHTGLFVLKPSLLVFKDMLHELDIGRRNPDGADQGFLTSYFSDLLDRPMFHPPADDSKLDGSFRLPMGYQMDASYYYLKLRWSIPCGPNSVITFPSAPWFKPWYWWSWPVLPLGLTWHEQRRKTLGYGAEVPAMLIQAAMYLAIMALIRLARPSLSKLCYNRRPEKISILLHNMLRVAALWSIIATYTVPFFLIPRTVHPILGWSLYFLGSGALASVVINAFLLPPLAILTPWIGFLGALIVLTFPWYSNGVVRALVLLAYAFLVAPFLWVSLTKVLSSIQILIEREAYFPKLGEPQQPLESSKHYWHSDDTKSI